MARCDRSTGKQPGRVASAHLLLRKPGAFATYLHRDEAFPTLALRQAYDRSCQGTVCSEQVRILRVEEAFAGNAWKRADDRCSRRSG